MFRDLVVFKGWVRFRLVAFRGLVMFRGLVVFVGLVEFNALVWFRGSVTTFGSVWFKGLATTIGIVRFTGLFAKIGAFVPIGMTETNRLVWSSCMIVLLAFKLPSAIGVDCCPLKSPFPWFIPTGSTPENRAFVCPTEDVINESEPMCCTTGVVPAAIIPVTENDMATAISNMHSRIDGIFDNPLTSTWHHFLEYQFFSGGEGLPRSRSINIGHCLRITRQKSIIYFSPHRLKRGKDFLLIYFHRIPNHFNHYYANIFTERHYLCSWVKE